MSRNYYVVLGVRITASQQEIELAYKGRRTQYHPDKYASQDEATLAWATQKMQELNEAYAALSDLKGREEHDRELSSSGNNSYSKRTSSPKPDVKPEKQLTFSEYLKATIGTPIGLDRVFVTPNIPYQKLQGAYSAHHRNLNSSDDIVVLIDDTVFGGAKEGIVISNNKIMFKELGEDPFGYNFSFLENITSRSNSIYINGSKILKLNLPEAAHVDLVVKALNDYQNGQRNPQKKSNALTKEGVAYQLEAAKERFKQLFKLLNETDQTEELAEIAVEQFENMDEALRLGHLITISKEAELIFELSHNAIEVIYEREEIQENLIEFDDEDSRVVTFLRGVLILLNEQQAEAAKKDRIKNFFN